MKRIVSLASTILVGVLFLGGIANQAAPGDGPARDSLSELEFVVVLPDGSRSSAHFLVRAGDPAEAAAAATSAVRALHPGAVLEDLHDHDAPAPANSNGGEGTVRAQWNAWGWQWDADEVPVPVLYNPAGAPAGFTAADVAAALSVWSVVEGTSFAFDYRGETSLPASMNVNGTDGANVIAWQDLGCDAGCVLGYTTKSFESHEVDVSMNSNPGANLSLGANGTWDAVSVLIHELGHVAGLEHSCPALGPCTDAEAEAVMFYAYSGVQRRLAEDDMAALRSLYPASATSSQALPSVSGSSGAGVIDSTSSSLHVQLSPGWNLTYLPAGNLQRFVTELRCVEGVYAWNDDAGSWQRWLRDLAPSLQTLTSTRATQSYWVLASAGCSAFFHD